MAPLARNVSIVFNPNPAKYVLGRGPLAASAADTDAVDNVALLGLVSEAASLVGAGGAAGAVDDLQLAELSMHSQQSSTSTPMGTAMCNPEGFFIPPSTVATLAESSQQLNCVYVRERASRSASCPTASSSEVPRHLRSSAVAVALAVLQRLHLRAPICGNVSRWF